MCLTDPYEQKDIWAPTLARHLPQPQAGSTSPPLPFRAYNSVVNGPSSGKGWWESTFFAQFVRMASVTNRQHQCVDGSTDRLASDSISGFQQGAGCGK